MNDSKVIGDTNVIGLTKVIGIDLGATNIRGAQVSGSVLSPIQARRINNQGTVDEVLNDIFAITDPLMDKEVAAIGIGVPGVLDLERGIVYDVQYIPSWKEVPLRSLMEQRYRIPVLVNNDANCFALGEYYFGKGLGSDNMIGLTIGTGLGAGIIIDKKLFAGANCGAGEFGMVDYLDHCYEYYASGQFFQNVYQTDGEQVFNSARGGDPRARAWYAEMGKHLGNAIKMIMYTYDATLILLGGSVRFAYPYFNSAMWERIRTFAYGQSIKNLRIEISELENSGVLGAAGLYYDSLR